MEKYFLNINGITTAHHTRQDLIAEKLASNDWQEITKEQYDAFKQSQEPSQDEIDKQTKMDDLEIKMDELRKDFAQDVAGLYVPNLDRKKELYRQYYTELCQLKGVQPKKEVL